MRTVRHTAARFVAVVLILGAVLAWPHHGSHADGASRRKSVSLPNASIESTT